LVGIYHDSFKFGEPLVNLDGYHKHFGVQVSGCTSSIQQIAGKQTPAFFRIQEYLDNHRKKIAKIIFEDWTKKSGLFACCGYKNGEKYLHAPSEPDVTDSGLARQHLMFGYQHTGWEFYRTGKEESVKKCEEINRVIDAYEAAVLAEIKREIRTSSDSQKLEEKSRKEVFIGENYPDKFDFKSLYLYRDVLSAIFNEAHNRNNKLAGQKVWIKGNNGYEYVVIGNLDSVPDYMGGKEQELGFGDHEMMVELKTRVERLIDDQKIRVLVNDYHVKKSELDTNPNISKYEEERKRIWRIVDKENKPLKGHCDICCESYLKSHF
jgi:hypothetical protein